MKPFRIIVIVIIVIGLIGAAWAVGHQGRVTIGGRAKAPTVGDTCTNQPGGSFNYNDGGPGYIEQTAGGLICQGPPPGAE